MTRVVGAVIGIPQQAALPGQSLGLGRAVRIWIVVQNQRHKKGGPQVLFVCAGNRLTKEGELGIDLLADVAQLRAQASRSAA